MRTTVNIVDTLLQQAREGTGVESRTRLIHDGLRALIERESARRLAKLRGSEPEIQRVPRRRIGVQ